MTNSNIAPDFTTQQTSSIEKLSIGSEATTDGFPCETGRQWLSFPRSFDTDGRELFPIQRLPAVLADYVEAFCETRGVPAGLVAPAALVAVSSSLGAGIEIETWDGLTTRGNLYWMGIAPSGAGKGIACEGVFGPNFIAEDSLIEQWQGQRAKFRAAEAMFKEQKQKALRRTRYDDVMHEDVFNEIANIEEQLEIASRRKQEPRIVCEDVTREKLGDILASQPGEALASVSSEARGILDVLTRLKGEDIYAKAWSGESYRNDRRSTKAVHLRKPCLSVAWMIQEDAWTKLLGNESFTTSGMLPRFLLSAPTFAIEPVPEQPRQIEPGVSAAYSSLIFGLLRQYRHGQEKGRTVHTDGDVLSLFRDYENEIRRMRNPGGHLQDIASFAARWTQNAFRIALVLHAATHGPAAHDEPLAPGTAQSALFISDWFRTEQVRLLTGRITQAANARANRLEDALRRYPNAAATIRDLSTRNGFKEAEIVALAEQQPQRFRVVEQRQARGTKGGRPSRVVELVKQVEATIPFPDLGVGFAGKGGFAGSARSMGHQSR
jgi:hypothetical protein